MLTGGYKLQESKEKRSKNTRGLYRSQAGEWEAQMLQILKEKKYNRRTLFLVFCFGGREKKAHTTCGLTEGTISVVTEHNLWKETQSIDFFLSF